MNKILEDTLKCIESYTILLQQNDIILIQAKENRGFIAGNNTEIKFALQQKNCDYIWILNNDVGGEGAVTAIGVVTKNVEPYSIVGNASAKKIGNRNLFYCLASQGSLPSYLR